MLRRSFLKGLVAAPVAAPVMARDAASAAGISPPLNTPPFKLDAVRAMTGAQTPAALDGSFVDYVRDELKRITSPEWENRTRAESARSVTRLDPDLASSKSLSLSAAIRLQAKRDADRRIEEVRGHWLAEFRKATGTEWLA